MSDVPATRRDPETAPTVYLVNPDSSASTVDLQAVLAPIWRWRWVELVIVVLSVLAAGWIVSRTSESRLLVIDCGHFEPEIVGEHITNVIIPTSAQARFTYQDKINSKQNQTNNESFAIPQVISVGYLLPPDVDDEAMLNNEVLTNLDGFFQKLAALAETQGNVRLDELNNALLQSEAILASLSSPVERGLARDEMQSHLNTIRDAIEREVSAEEILRQRIQQIEKDANSTGEIRELQNRLSESMALRSKLEVDLAQSETEVMSISSRPSVDDIYRENKSRSTSAARALASTRSLIENGFAYQPPVLIDASNRKRSVEYATATFAGIILAGFFAAIFAAYALEALRLARLGAARS